MILANKKINFLGDSITEGHGTSGKDAIFMNVLAREANLAAARNYGIGGTRIAAQYEGDYTSLAFCERFGEMDDDADAVVVYGGTNDYGHGTAPVGSLTDVTKETFYGALRYLIEGLLEKYPAAQIVFMTPIHRENENALSVGNNLPLSRYVEIIKEVCAYYAVPVCDLWSISGIQPDCEILKRRYCPDGLHPNDEGHRLIAARLKGFLESL